MYHDLINHCKGNLRNCGNKLLSYHSALTQFCGALFRGLHFGLPATPVLSRRQIPFGYQSCFVGNKTHFSISVDNQRFILRELRGCCGKPQFCSRQFAILVLQTNFRLLPTSCSLFSVIAGSYLNHGTRRCQHAIGRKIKLHHVMDSTWLTMSNIY